MSKCRETSNREQQSPDSVVAISAADMSGLSIQEKADAMFLNSEILAPMVRASTAPLRSLALSYGADLVFTEEIVDRSITTCERVVHSNDEGSECVDYIRKMNNFSPKVQKRLVLRQELPVVLRILPGLERGKLVYQMGTGEANLALTSALYVEKDVDGLDINMGCPKKFSISGGMGSALLDDLPRACDIIQTLRRNLVSLPVSAKIRLLKDTASTLHFVKSLIKAGANAITIHAREVGDESANPARWDRLEEVVQLLKGSETVPIIINGDFYTRNDMVNMRRRCKADGVMLARPALFNTSIFIKPPSDAQLPDHAKETRYGYNSPLLRSKFQVVQDYVSHACLYHTNQKNVKYVICEMLSNRRTPSVLVPFLPLNISEEMSIDKVCRCKGMKDLCLLWKVNPSAAFLKFGNESVKEPQFQSVADEHKYDDRYFLDPKALQNERAEKGALLENDKKVVKLCEVQSPIRDCTIGENNTDQVSKRLRIE